MATVFVVTAGTGDTYRIERVYLDSDQAHRFAQDYNGMVPMNRSRWRSGRPVRRRLLSPHTPSSSPPHPARLVAAAVSHHSMATCRETVIDAGNVAPVNTYQ